MAITISSVRGSPGCRRLGAATEPAVPLLTLGMPPVGALVCGVLPEGLRELVPDLLLVC